MAPLLVELFLGIYLGLLTGIVPALVAGVLGFLFRYVTGVTLPGLGVVVLAVAIAGVNGGLLGLVDPTISQSPRLLSAVVVVMMLSLYAHAQGDRLGERLPRRFSLRELGKRTLSGEAIFDVGGIGRVEIEPIGDVNDLEGYPPLGEELRAEIAADRWEFAADVPIEAIERSLEERLRTRYDLAAVEVRIDVHGRARIAAAPPLGSLSLATPSGRRTVSVRGLVPTGIARGERVAVVTEDRRIDGTVLSARSSPDAGAIATPGGGPAEDAVAPMSTAPRTTGGEGSVAVAVTPEEARYLLGIDRARIVVLPRGSGLEFEAVRRLRSAGNRFVAVTVSHDGAGQPLASVAVATGVRILARYPAPSAADARGRDWQIDPDGEVRTVAGDELIAVGQPDATAALEEALR